MPTRVFDGSKKIFRRGPPASKPGSSVRVDVPGADHRRRVVHEHAIARVHPVVRRAAVVEQLGQRRVDAARAERPDRQVEAVERQRSLTAGLGHARCRPARGQRKVSAVIRVTSVTTSAGMPARVAAATIASRLGASYRQYVR